MSFLFFGRKRSREDRNRPKRYRLSESLMAAIFERRDEEGRRRFGWSLDRYNESDPDRPFRVLPPVALLQTPTAIGELAEMFAEAESLPHELRKKLANLAAVMAQVGELTRQQVNGEDEDESESLRPSRALPT
jgi:hypothetical protein